MVNSNQLLDVVERKNPERSRREVIWQVYSHYKNRYGSRNSDNYFKAMIADSMTSLIAEEEMLKQDSNWSYAIAILATIAGVVFSQKGNCFLILFAIAICGFMGITVYYKKKRAYKRRFAIEVLKNWETYTAIYSYSQFLKEESVPEDTEVHVDNLKE